MAASYRQPTAMSATVSTTVTELPESRVRVQAEVPPEEVERRVAQAARQLGRSLRVPGFRQGKVPPPVIIQRVGRQAVLDEAVRDSLGTWYSAAIDDAKIVPVGEPDLDLGDLPDEGQPLTFSIEIGVRPTAELGEYKGLEVGKAEPEVADEEVEREVEQLRERTAKLETVERAADTGDFLVMDYLGTLEGEPFPGGEGRDQLVELGSGRLVPGFEEQLAGAVAGEERALDITFPEASDSGDEGEARGRGASELAGREAQFAVTVKEVKEKVLPALDDDFAADQGFDDMAELRADIRERLAEVQSQRIDREFREAAVDSAVANAKVGVPDKLVHARAHELWDQMLHSLAHQGIDKQTYLRITGQEDEEELVKQAEPDAERALKREAVLAAIVEAEGIEASDEEIEEALAPTAQRERTNPAKLRKRLEQSGRIDVLKADVAVRKAVDLVAENAVPIPVEQAQARDKLWTPEKEEAGESPAGGRLWTPGS